jgi:hypothetical protein
VSSAVRKRVAALRTHAIWELVPRECTVLELAEGVLVPAAPAEAAGSASRPGRSSAVALASVATAERGLIPGIIGARAAFR